MSFTGCTEAGSECIQVRLIGSSTEIEAYYRMKATRLLVFYFFYISKVIYHSLLCTVKLILNNMNVIMIADL
jgi:hypothetical protein